MRKAKFRLRTIIRFFVHNKIVRIVVILLVFLALGFAAKHFFSSPTFDIIYIEINGNKNVKTADIHNSLSDLLGRNIFLVRSSKLAERVEKLSPYIKNIKVEKRIPDLMIITIEERIPSFVWINLSGTYLLDDEGFVLETISDFTDLELSDEDFDLLKGYGDISEQEDAKKDEEGKEAVEVTKDEKYQILETKRKEVISRVDHFWVQNLKEIDKKYRKYPFVYNYSVNNLNILDKLDDSIVSMTLLGVSIDFLAEDPSRYVWESEYRFVLYLPKWKKIIFSTRRDFELQIEDLRILLSKLKQEGKSFQTIDLSADIIMYELET